MGMKPIIDVHIEKLLLERAVSFDEKRFTRALELELAKRLADGPESRLVTPSDGAARAAAVQVGDAIEKGALIR